MNDLDLDLDLNSLSGIGKLGLMRKGSRCRARVKSGPRKGLCKRTAGVRHMRHKAGYKGGRGGPWNNPRGKRCVSRTGSGKKVNCTRQDSALKGARKRARKHR